jgi:hypothetical protein
MTTLEHERSRRRSAAEALQQALIELRNIRAALDFSDVATARQACERFGDALENVEAKTGVCTPASLFDEVAR